VGPTCRRENKKKKKEEQREGVRAEAGWAAARSWAPGAAQVGLLSSFLFFFLCFLFFCSDFCFGSKLFQNSFKSIQTKF
jgi:hypothetical protein